MNGSSSTTRMRLPRKTAFRSACGMVIFLAPERCGQRQIGVSRTESPALRTADGRCSLHPWGIPQHSVAGGSHRQRDPKSRRSVQFSPAPIKGGRLRDGADRRREAAIRASQPVARNAPNGRQCAVSAADDTICRTAVDSSKGRGLAVAARVKRAHTDATVSVSQPRISRVPPAGAAIAKRRVPASARSARSPQKSRAPVARIEAAARNPLRGCAATPAMPAIAVA